MRNKLKDCKNVRVRDYQHRRDYVVGDKVWFQPLNGNAWIGPALVVTQRGQSVYLHTHGDLKKIAACRVKPYELVNTDENASNTKEVMKEDGLGDVDNLYTENLIHNVKYTAALNKPENDPDASEETVWHDACESLDENTNEHTLATLRYISFEDACTYTVQLPISEHHRPEVKVAKKAEVKNLQDYETFVEVKDEGQKKVGSRWVITEKEQHDSQKTKVKARLVACGFQEAVKP